MAGKITVGNTTGLENNNNTNLKLNPFPNPTNGPLKIIISEKNKNFGDKTLTIYNLNGAKLSQEKIKEENNIQLNVEGLPKGQYFYQISSGKEIIVSGKFIKLDN
ncbi:MAG: T9SS type A sorting domain-containing protein [Bacteroidales bacterium]|nr:T9SS type A sorting domain-containing protein [Bacteroidales bacterium]